MLRSYLFASLAPLSSRRYARPSMAFNARPVTDQSASPHEWVARIRAGDEAAFEAMFRAHYAGLCRSIATYLGSRDSAEDVVQGVFARIWDGRALWVVRDLEHYLYAAVRRRAMSEFRRAAVRRRAAPLLALDGAGAFARPPDADFEAEELRRRLERALSALPPRTRTAFVLSRREGLSYAEVASRMAISPKTIGVHISRALTVLRKALLPS
ncbi:MAG TPA: RNA polymerase sigma-70 factor [Gemmatimonadales bacterium]|nr:RNA polymerase sigma-70 factor [Gemmatimonadales bacterium]